MRTYTDLTIITDFCYKFAKLIEGGHYSNIFYYEFHDEVNALNIYNCLEGLEEFRERSEAYYNIFISYGWVDEMPATISVVLKVNDEWFFSKECGSNYYLGYGPSGILKLREACAKMNIVAFASNENFENWIKNKFGYSKKALSHERNHKDRLQFEQLCKSLQSMTSDMQRRPEQFQGMSEDNIRDKMLVILNSAFSGRGHAESKSRKGKTDIVVRTKDGLNEHIFELKVWEGINTIEKAIDQLKGYLSWHNNYCGIIIFCYKKNYTQILAKAEEFLQGNHNFDKREKYIENEFRIQLIHDTDSSKSIQTHIVFINLVK